MSGDPVPQPGPAVLATDEQDEVALDPARWAAFAESALRARGVTGSAELGLRFVGRGEMERLNQEHLGGSGPTDVLAFPIEAPSELQGAETMPPLLLGDVVVCPDVAARQAPEHAGTFEDELALLVVHGILHVLGMDHADPTEAEAMRVVERELLAALHGPIAADPWSTTLPPAR